MYCTSLCKKKNRITYTLFIYPYTSKQGLDRSKGHEGNRKTMIDKTPYIVFLPTYSFASSLSSPIFNLF